MAIHPLPNVVKGECVVLCDIPAEHSGTGGRMLQWMPVSVMVEYAHIDHDITEISAIRNVS